MAEQKGQIPGSKIFGGAILLAVIVAAVVAASSGPAIPPLKGKVVRDWNMLLTVSNDDESEWQDCKLQINDTFDLDGRSIAAGSSLVLKTSDFSDGEGRRFNPFTMVIKTVWINCAKASGERRDGLFTFKN